MPPFELVMVPLRSLCCPFRCCRPKIRKEQQEEPYGVIIRDDSNAANDKNAAHVSFRLPSGGEAQTRERFSHPMPSTSHTSHRDQKLTQRSSLPSSNANKSVKRALPKLPGLDGDPSIETYTSIERRHTSPLSHATSKANHSNSTHPFNEDGINPTYESIDAESDSVSDPVYSKVDSGNTRKYDYPVFHGPRSHAAAVNVPEAVYQSASQIYTVGSEDPYSSITSGGGAETNYPSYAHVKDSIANPRSSKAVDNSDSKPSTSENIDDLYTKIQRPSPSCTLSTKGHVPREGGEQFIPLPSTSYQQSDANQGYVSCGSEKASREPSYRYITVRESVDVIRRRLNEREMFSGAHTPPASISRNMSNTSESIDGTLPIREHYYSSIGGGSDYESVSVAALYEHIPDLSTGNMVNEQTSGSSREVNSSFDVLKKSDDGTQASTSSSVRFRSTSRNRGDTSEKISDNSSPSVPPKPPTSPIPNRISSDAIDVKCFRYSDDPKVIPFIESSPPYASIQYDSHNKTDVKSNKSSPSNNTSTNSTTNVLQPKSHLCSSPPNNSADVDKSNNNKTVSKSDQSSKSSVINTDATASNKLSNGNIPGTGNRDEEKTNRETSHSIKQYGNPQLTATTLSGHPPNSNRTIISASDTDHEISPSRVTRFLSPTVSSQSSAAQRNSLPEYRHSQISPHHITNSCTSVLPSAPYRTSKRSPMDAQSHEFNSAFDGVRLSKSMNTIERTVPTELKPSQIETVSPDLIRNITRNKSYRSEIEAYVVKPSLSSSTPLINSRGVHSNPYKTERNDVMNRSVHSTDGSIGRRSLKSTGSVRHDAEHDSDKTETLPSSQRSSASNYSHPVAARTASRKSFTNSLMKPPTPESIFQPLSPGTANKANTRVIDRQNDQCDATSKSGK